MISLRNATLPAFAARGVDAFEAAAAGVEEKDEEVKNLTENGMILYDGLEDV